MPASAGTPTIFDKLRVGVDAIFGHLSGSPVDAATLAGLQRDVSTGVSDLQSLFGATISAIEADSFGDVSKFLTGIATAIPVGSVTSLATIVNVVVQAAKALGGPISTQIGTIESSALNTLVSAASLAAGHVNLTAA